MKTLKFLTATVVIALVLAFALRASFLKWEQTYGIGSVVDNFILKSINGNYVSLSDYKNSKGVILVFTSFRCPYSKNHDKKLQKLDERYGPQGYALIAIDPTISETDIFKSLRNRISKTNFSFPYLLDENQGMAEQFDVKKVPTAFILQKKKPGFIISYFGPIDNFSNSKNHIDTVMDQLLNTGKITTEKVKITGCRIKS